MSRHVGGLGLCVCMCVCVCVCVCVRVHMVCVYPSRAATNDAEDEFAKLLLWSTVIWAEARPPSALLHIHMCTHAHAHTHTHTFSLSFFLSFSLSLYNTGILFALFSLHYTSFYIPLSLFYPSLLTSPPSVHLVRWTILHTQQYMTVQNSTSCLQRKKVIFR